MGSNRVPHVMPWGAMEGRGVARDHGVSYGATEQIERRVKKLKSKIEKGRQAHHGKGKVGGGKKQNEKPPACRDFRFSV